jgi:hypothetical protein
LLPVRVSQRAERSSINLRNTMLSALHLPRRFFGGNESSY